MLYQYGEFAQAHQIFLSESFSSSTETIQVTDRKLNPKQKPNYYHLLEDSGVNRRYDNVAYQFKVRRQENVSHFRLDVYAGRGSDRRE